MFQIVLEVSPCEPRQREPAHRGTEQLRDGSGCSARPRCRRSWSEIFDVDRCFDCDQFGQTETARRQFITQRYLPSRKRRLLVKRFRNNRRRSDRFWKHTELARYLLERLLLVGPMQGGVVEA